MIRFALSVGLLVVAREGMAATLIVRAEGVASAQGSVYVGLCDRSFEEATCPYGGRARARAGIVEVRVPNVPPGRYAVAVYHDRNENGKLDRTAIGLPTEPYGFSNDVGRTSIPDFQRALVTISAPSTTIAVPVRPGFWTTGLRPAPLQELEGMRLPPKTMLTGERP